jgi:hypothetical protein
MVRLAGMTVNANKPERWKADIAQSVALYNTWFMRFAPEAYRTERVKATKAVESALQATDNLRNIEPALLRRRPVVLKMLRMATAPPIARDRLSGLANVSKSLIKTMEDKERIPRRGGARLDEQLRDMSRIIARLADKDIFPWLDDGREPTEVEIYRAATIVADRQCGAATDPIVRNAQEQRQLTMIGQWLEARGYKRIGTGTGITYQTMPAGTFTFHLNVPGTLENGNAVNITVDAAIKSPESPQDALPILIEAKSAGDFTNTNKRRKEEATKIAQLRRRHGREVMFVLFLCGYFDGSYLGYEAAEGIDWIWEHRIDDMAELGL